MNISPAILTANATGRCGENLVAYYLERAGIQCTVVDRRGVDLWCRTAAGSLFQLEVKTATTSAPRRVGGPGSVYSFEIRTRECDWYAFVALDTEMLLIKHIDDIRPYRSQKIETHYFKPTLMLNSLGRMVRDVDSKAS